MCKGWQEAERRVLRLLHGRKTRMQLTQIHAHFLRHNLHRSNQILSHFVSVCASFHKMRYANAIFRQTHNPNIFLFNSMIKGYSLCGPFEDSVHLFSLMKTRGMWPDEFTFAPLLKSCSNLSCLKIGRGVHAEILTLGFECFTSIRIGIVELYVTYERMDEAEKMFDAMPQRDVIVWNLMIRGYCKMGDIEMAFRLFRQMEDRNTVSWNSMISGLAQNSHDAEALELFCKMRDDGLELDEVTVVTVLPVCARLGAIDVGQWIHSWLESSGLFENVISVGNSLVDFYCKCGNLEAAFMVFKDMPSKNVVSWNAMISGLAFNGKCEDGVHLFEEMTNNGVNPNDSTFVGVLTCCAHGGLVHRGQDLFASMIPNHQLEPKLEHYGCMVDLLGRNGCVKEAYGLICSMPMKPNAALWGALLSASCTHGDVELAERAVEELIRLEPWNSGNYVLLSNIYAERGKWDDVAKLRVLMRDNSINKAPGQSMVG